ncbi:F0F1 ATP synthase subunit B/delta [Mycolicibacterium moriokaense]|nr:F0F1 ATP synthase subunit B/delta [Mycolicibacterium moriokaense]
MSTFIGQLIGFAVIVFLIWKYVVPPVRTMMKNQQETVRNQLQEHSEAGQKVADADKEHAKALEEAKAEAAKVIEEARHDAEKIAEQLRVQADAELERIKTQGGQQVQLLRQQLIRELRQSLGAESVHRAHEMVSNFVSNTTEQSATVDRFLAELDEMAPSSKVFADAVTAKLRAASRESVAELARQFDGVAADLDADGLTRLAGDLASAVKLLRRESVLARHLADPSSDTASRVQLVDRLLSGKVSDAALRVLKTASEQRWSSTADLIYGIQHIAGLALLVRAERDDQIEDVEDELFRFSRILDSQPRLITLLSDYTTPLDGRISLLNNVLARRASKNTADLLRQTVELLHGGRADESVRELANLAVSRRGEVVAHVRAAAELSDAQSERLTELLSRIYGHPVSVQLDVDPALIGGLTIAVGDEVIDGSLSSKLASAETQLPD